MQGVLLKVFSNVDLGAERNHHEVKQVACSYRKLVVKLKPLFQKFVNLKKKAQHAAQQYINARERRIPGWRSFRQRSK